jgi:hypothetical protein
MSQMMMPISTTATSQSTATRVAPTSTGIGVATTTRTVSDIDPARIADGRQAGSYTVKELKGFLRQLALPLSGTKPDLARRLREALNL